MKCSCELSLHSHIAEMTMESRGLSIALLITALVLSCETSETEEQLDTCVWVEVNWHQSHNSSDLTCGSPEKPVNGGYVREVERYNAGETITYYCNTGHQLIGQVNRTCNVISKQWEPDEPYCQPEYVGQLMRRLNDIEAEMRVIKQSIATLENTAIQIGHNLSDKVSTIEKTVSDVNNTKSASNNKVSAIESNGSATYNMSKMASVKLQVETDRLLVCTGNTTENSEDTVTKCKTMQSGVRNGRSVSVYTWVIEDYMKEVASPDREVYSQPFYHTVPGHKFRLRGYLYEDSDMRLYLQLLPGEYDDQLKWPFSTKYDVTALTNAGVEVPHMSSPGEQSSCPQYRPTSPTQFACYTLDSNWDDIWGKKKQILSNGSVVAKLYFYN